MKNLRLLKHFSTRIILAALFILPLLAGFTSPAAADSDSSSRAVYTITNASSGNEVLVYQRSADGSLSFITAYSTGGLGSGGR